MKLTKGKLSKLFHKKKQTMRRYKNERKYRRASKTFRQRKPLNLHRSSMKKIVDPRKIEWIGGTDPEEKVPLVVKPASEEITTFTLGSDESPQVNTPESVSAPESTPTPATTSESTTESVPAPEPVDMTEPEPKMEPEPAPEPAPEPESVPAPEPETKMEPEPETKMEPAPYTAPETIIEPEPKYENMNTDNSSSQPSVADALNIIADKIATAVVMKMREKPATGSSSNQDADIAVPLAINAVIKQTQLAPEK
jgi:hypothetical protein